MGRDMGTRDRYAHGEYPRVGRRPATGTDVRRSESTCRLSCSREVTSGSHQTGSRKVADAASPCDGSRLLGPSSAEAQQ
jgi:hypothetical protein